MANPNFIGVGGHKCASTWLAECMRDHPEVFVSNPKETGYFVDHLDKGVEWYLQHFSGASTDHHAVGEFTSYYLYNEDALKNIKDTIGKVKIVVVIRDPVERAVSQIKHGIRNGTLPHQKRIERRDLEAIIKKYPRVVDRSRYYFGLSMIVDLFGRENLLVFNQADFVDYPQECLVHLWKFLGVDDSFVPSRATKKISSGIVPRYQALENFRQSVFRKVMYWPGVVPFVRKSGLGEIYRRLNGSRSKVYLEEDGVELLKELLVDDWNSSVEFCFDPK
ncbi:sulfotransferase domain-containing protein [Halomonas almeriensis]|uniref:sulfotransferase domain-containing protein n=1 Tax=Halomonas almeriensis TaxID=308163 RepID=UPI0025B2E0CA|nr:sulfotransferase domain-containing protein [Halomonas almeriensis]MDN3552595.1 sulfotransferase domain-containing protein [Halomonas almeriensis]